MSGAYGEVVMYFGRFKDYKLAAVPNGYLNYLLNQDWFEESYPDLFNVVQDEMHWRLEQGVHVEEK